MSKTVKDRLIGVLTTIISSGLMFLIYSYFGQFETVQASDKKISNLKEEITSEYQKDVVQINNKLSSIICYLDKEKCLPNANPSVRR